MNEERAGTECKEAPSAPAAAPSQHQPTEPPKEAQAAARATRATAAAVDPAPKPPLIRRFLRRLRPRFSLRTLLVAMLLACSAFALRLHWEPWVPVARMKTEPARFEHLAFSEDGARVVGMSLDGDFGLRSWDARTGSLLSMKPYQRASKEVLLSSQGRSLRAEADREFPEPPLVLPKELEEPLRLKISYDLRGEKECDLNDPGVRCGWIDPPIVHFIKTINFLAGWEDGKPPVMGLRTYPDPPLLKLHPLTLDSDLERPPPAIQFEEVTIREILETFHHKGGWRYWFSDGSIVVLPPDTAHRLRERTVRLWDLETCAFVNELSDADGGVMELETTRDGRFLLGTVVSDPPPNYFDVKKGEPEPKWNPWCLWIWSVDDGHCCGRIPLEGVFYTKIVSMSADGQRGVIFGFGNEGPHCLVWSLKEDRAVLRRSIGKEATFAQISPDGRRLLAAYKDDRAVLLDVDSGAEIRHWEIPAKYSWPSNTWPGCLEFTPDGTRIVGAELSGEGNERLGLRDAKTGEAVPMEDKPAEYGYSVNEIHFDAAGRRVVASNESAAEGLWDVRHGTWLGEIPPYAGDPDTMKLKAIWTWADEHLNPWYEPPYGAANPFAPSVPSRPAASFSPDGELLLACDRQAIPYILQRRRPEWWWGVAWLPEFWLTVVFACVLLWSLRRDWKFLKAIKS